jgi:hypothetical protein
LTSRQIDR